MNGAIFFSGQYGSTAQYAAWIGEATGLPVFDVNRSKADPAEYDFLVLGSSVIIYKLTIRAWLEKHLSAIRDKPTILFTVSGAPAGPQLDGWIANSVPSEILAHARHVALRGRLILAEIPWWVRWVLKVGAWASDDPEAKAHELEGFDFMEKSSIAPIVALVREIRETAG